MTTEEYIKLLLGEKDVQLAMLRSQLDEAKAKLAELEKPQPEKKLHSV